MSARLGYTRSNMTYVSPSHEELRSLLVGQFRRLVQDGAAALQLDKTCCLGPMDFNPRLSVGPDRSLTQGVLLTFKETLDACREIDPAFCLASEIWWDRAIPLVDVSYMRMGTIDCPLPTAMLRYTFPEWTSTIFAENPGDFNVMSNGMRYGMAWALAPRHYNDSLDETLTRPLARYVRELIRIRKRHEDILFLGRFLDTDGAAVKAGPHVRHSVFEGLDARGRACVLVNYDDRAGSARVAWADGSGGRVTVCQPFRSDTTSRLPATVTLPARSCVVLVSK